MANLRNINRLDQANVKIVPLGDELRQLQHRLGWLRRQTGRLAPAGKSGQNPPPGR